jgi:septal ring factor EnvC (AmiA/AmiB activator)
MSHSPWRRTRSAISAPNETSAPRLLTMTLNDTHANFQYHNNMSDNIAEMTFELLKRLQADMAEMRRDHRDLRDRVASVEGHVAAMRVDQARLAADQARISAILDRISDRLERIERRLDLAPAT